MTTLPIAQDVSAYMTSESLPGAESKPVAVQIPRMWLLATYAIIPASMIAVFIDYMFLGGWLKMHLPRSPETLLLFTVFFVEPHTFASVMSFCDTEYLKYYGKRIVIPLLIFLGVIFFYPSFIHVRAIIVVYAVWSMIHFTGQQIGIARSICGTFNWGHTVLRWMGVVIAVPIYFNIYSVVPLSHKMNFYLLMAIYAACAIFLVVTCIVYRTTNTKIAKIFLLANGVGALTETIFYAMGYYFFVILVTRIIHDLCAFTFYISHDLNRNAGGMKNIFYRSLGFLRLPIYVLCPLASILISLPLSSHLYQDWAMRIWIPFTLFHYYTESFAWRRGSLHRAYIQMR